MYSEKPEINSLLIQIIKVLEIQFEQEESLEKSATTKKISPNTFGSIQMIHQAKTLQKGEAILLEKAALKREAALNLLRKNNIPKELSN